MYSSYTYYTIFYAFLPFLIDTSRSLEPTAHAVVVDTLPEGWQPTLDPSSGRTFYHNATTGATQWDKPVLAVIPVVIPPGTLHPITCCPVQNTTHRHSDSLTWLDHPSHPFTHHPGGSGREGGSEKPTPSICCCCRYPSPGLATHPLRSIQVNRSINSAQKYVRDPFHIDFSYDVPFNILLLPDFLSLFD